MKIEKNKIIFASVIGVVLLFMGAYAVHLYGKDTTPKIETGNIPVPELEDNAKEYNSKLEALDDLKDVKQTNAPSIYDERLIDSSGVFDPDLLEKEKQRVVDSIYRQGRIDYSSGGYRTPATKRRIQKKLPTEKTSHSKAPGKEMAAIDLQAFFHTPPATAEKDTLRSDALMYVVVNSTQTVKKDYRLELRLAKAAWIRGKRFAANTLLYGFVSFKPNRTLLDITHIGTYPVALKAYDFQDGSEGIYMVNTYKADASDALLQEAIDEINVPAVPQVGVLKKVFRRNNRNVKVTVMANYKLLLRPAD